MAEKPTKRKAFEDSDPEPEPEFKWREYSIRSEQQKFAPVMLSSYYYDLADNIEQSFQFLAAAKDYDLSVSRNVRDVIREYVGQFSMAMCLVERIARSAKDNDCIDTEEYKHVSRVLSQMHNARYYILPQDVMDSFNQGIQMAYHLFELLQ